MELKRFMACAVLSTAVFAGCEREDTGRTAGTGAGTGTSAGSGTSGTSGTTATPAAGETSATPTTMPTAATATDPAAQTAAAQSAAAQSDAPAAATTQPDAAVTAQAQTLLDQTVTYIKANKMELAEKSLTQLEQLKPRLPATWHGKIDSARKAFNAAKTGQGLKLDGLLPGSTK